MAVNLDPRQFLSVKIPDSIVQALELDDASMVVSYAQGAFPVVIELLAVGARVTGTREALRRFADDVGYRSMAESDLPFNLRGACGKVAKRIRKEVASA